MRSPAVSLSRRQLLLMGAALSLGAPALAAPTDLPLAASLPNELASALKQGQALVVMVSLAGCPFCHVVRNNFLGPLHTQQGLPVVQVDIRSSLTLKDFKGANLTHDELRRSWGVKVAPTVLFFGAGGREIADRLVGGSIPDFYGAYLDERLRIARTSLKS